jgi:hypothetical protein
MRTYSALPRPLLDDWVTRDITQAPGTRVGYHYHDTDEWLEVLRGGMTFVTLSERAWPLTPGAVFFIPRGEVHRVDIGSEGVDYRMFVPIATPTGFANELSPDQVQMLQVNLAFPAREENTDGAAAPFFAAHLSDALAFARADGAIVGKDTFREGFIARDRRTSGTACVLHRTADSLLLSTVVTVGATGPAPKHFTNMRLFVREGAAWRCRLWMNYPEPAHDNARHHTSI